MREIVHALRKLRRAPVVTVGVLLTLSLAIGVLWAVAHNGPEFGRLNPICMASRSLRRHACRNAPQAGFEQSRQGPL